MADKPRTDLEKAFAALDAKTKPYGELFDYYDGKQKLKYNSKRFREIFKNLNADFTENWTAVVIDSTYNRVNLLGAKIAGDETGEKETGVAAALKRIKDRLLGKSNTEQETLDKLLEDNQLLLDSDDVHSVAGIIGESFYFVWKNEEGEVEGFYNDPRLVHVFYEEENPRIKKYAAKWWVDDKGNRRLTLYYPDRLEYYAAKGDVKTGATASGFTPVDQDGAKVEKDANQVENPFGKVPVFHFRPERRKIKSDLVNVIQPQDAINKLASDMMIVSEFGALRQRFVISDTDVQGALKNAPNEIWWIPAGDGTTQRSEVGELESSDPSTYLKPIMHNISAISSITGTPKHFFFEGGKSQISGEALIALEAPLNDKAQARIDIFGPVWQDVLSFMLEISGTEIPARNILVVFEPPETLQPLTRAKIRRENRASGIPLVTTLRREGWNQADLDQLIVDQDEERTRQQASLGAAVMAAQRDFDNPEGEEEGGE